MIQVALDAMGGDNAPDEIIAGAILARKKFDVDITLVGDRDVIERTLKHQNSPFSFPIVHCEEVATMADLPSEIIRKKKDASILVATRLVADGKCDAVVSAGNTGAQMAGALFTLGRIKGVDRPGIMTAVPSINGGFTFMCDSGTVVDAKPKNILDFAVMTSAFVEHVIGIESPKVALLNVGEEAEKGSELAKAAYKLLSKSQNINFIGNMESRHILRGEADVLVTDGFSGNILLKSVEGMGKDLIGLFKEVISTTFVSKIGGLLIRKHFSKIKKLLDYSEYGGAPLLGVKGVSIVSHGVSDGKTIASAIRQAIRCADGKLVEKISEAIS